jgi:hypothetical protein
MFIGVQVSFLLLRATSVGLWEFFFRPLVVVLAAVDLVLADFGEEVVDVRSMLKLRIDGGGGSPVLEVVNSGLASSWNSARAFASRWRRRPCDDGNWRCV